MSMHPELARPEETPRVRPLRADARGHCPAVPQLRSLAWPILGVLAGTFVLLGAGDLDVGPIDARVGLAASGPFGPLGQVYGHWAPDLWPGRVAVSALASLFEEGRIATAASVLWPAALSAVAIGALLAWRLMQSAGTGTGLWFGLCWFGCLGVIDHSAGTGLDLVSGLAVVAALDRLLSRGSDGTAGLWTSLAFLTGGWPPVLVILLAVLVIGRKEAGYSPRLLVPPLAAFAAWSAWAISTASTEAWAAALAWPFTRPPEWWLAPGVLAMGLPFAPFAVLALHRSLREVYNEPWRRLLTGWTQVALACLIAGTIVPGLAQAARVPALVGILMAAASGLDAAWTRRLAGPTRRLYFGIVIAILAAWLAALLYGDYVWTFALPYYRPFGIATLVLGIVVLALGWSAVETANTRRAMMALAVLTLSLKLVHWGYFVPEWNYRLGQGPWGRAIGQWLMPNWTLYIFHEWPADLALAIARPVRKLHGERQLEYESGPEARHVLLTEPEFEHWPEQAPRIHKVAAFHDPRGDRRILARTDGILLTPSGRLLPRGEAPGVHR
jgi:hypothetical protein